MKNVGQSPLRKSSLPLLLWQLYFLKGHHVKIFQGSSLGASGEEVFSPPSEDVLDASDQSTPPCFPFLGESSASLIRGWLSRQEGKFDFINRQLTFV